MRKLSLGLSFVAMASLVACGDGSGTNADSNLLGNSSNSTSESVDKYDGIVEEPGDLPKCSEKKDGKIYYVKDAGVAYTCQYDVDDETGEWVGKKNGDDEDQKSSSSVKKADISSSSEESANEYDGEVEEFDDLPKCTAKKEGKVYYVEDEDVTYTCKYDEDEEAGEWVSKKKKPSDDDQESSSSAKKTDISSSSGKSEDGSSSSEESDEESSSSAGSIYDPEENTLTDLRDGRVYRTTTIAPEGTGYSEVWMAENLNYSDSIATPSLKGRQWCNIYRAENCAVSVEGRLYTWTAAIDSIKVYDGGNGATCGSRRTCTLPPRVQGICPSGWHLPSYDEWDELITAVGGEDIAGKVLKSQTGWYSDGGNGTDAYGFTALPAGFGDINGNFISDGNDTGFWSVTEYDSASANIMALHYFNTGYYVESDNAMLGLAGKNAGYSVRCLKD